MEPIKIKIINRSGNPLPAYQTLHSAGMDLHAFLEQDLEIAAGKRALIPTGLFIEIPTGYEAQIRPRSGLALKHGITVLNSPGTIDADYRGEIMVLLINLGDTTFAVRQGERIAQMIVSSHAQVSWEAVEVIGDTERGDGGYGSSGS